MNLKNIQKIFSFKNLQVDSINWFTPQIYLNIDLNDSFFFQHFKDKIVWNHLTYYRLKDFSDQFIEKYKDKIDWFWLSSQKQLSEQFIEKYKDYVNWHWIFEYQTLSKEFIKKNEYRKNRRKF